MTFDRRVGRCAVDRAELKRQRAALFVTVHRLNELIGANRRACYRLQFRATARALIRRAADPWELLGGVKIGLVTVLHTWGQAMLRHIHSHVVLPGGGFSLDGGQWVSSPGREFFLDVARLADAYRDTYLRSLWRMYRAGELVFPSSLAPLADERAFRQFIRPLEAIRWVIDCGSPEHAHRPEAALDYLARYVVGSAISDARIVSDQGGQVTIRIKDYRQGAARDTISMLGEEFVRRFLMHVLSSCMARVCYGGFLGNRHRRENLYQARTQLAVVVYDETEETDRIDESSEPIELEAETKMPCPRCGQFTLAWITLIPAAGTWRERVNMIPRVVRRRIERELAAALDASASHASSAHGIRGPPGARENTTA